MNRLAFESMPFTFREGLDSSNWERGGQRRRHPPKLKRDRRPPPGPPWMPPRDRHPPVRDGGSGAIGAGAAQAQGEPCVCPAHGTEFVRWVQSTLNRVEGTGLPVNGVMDAAWRAALRRFQSRRGLPADGIAGPDTERALLDARRSTARPARAGEVADGSRGQVAWVQSALNRLLGLQLTADGIAGTQTRAAIRSFQQRQGLAPDGIVGPLTLAALQRATSGIPATSTPATSYITIRPGVQLTPQISAVVEALEPHFRAASLPVTLTSGFRPPSTQLRLIRDQAVKRGLERLYPSILNATVDRVDSWIDAWDDLLHRQGYVINPPVPACSRIRPRKCYAASPHSTGLAFDLSGADLDRIAAVVQGYCRNGGALRQILVERTNNAVHVGIDSAGRAGPCDVSHR